MAARNKRNMFVGLALCACLLLGSFPHLSAAEGSTSNERGEEATSEFGRFPDISDLPSSRLDKAKNDFLRTHGFHEGFNNPKGAYIGWAQATSTLPTQHVGWAKARIFAFEKAMSKAKEEFISIRQRQITTEKTRQLTDIDAFGDRPLTEMEQETFEKRLREKLKKVSEKALDKALQELGMTREQIRNMSGPKKRLSFYESIQRTSTRTAAGDVAGLRVLKTFEGANAEGTSAIGVVVLWTPTFSHLARSILHGEGFVDRRRAGQMISEQIPEKPENLVDEFGVRTLRDKNGDRAVVVFGQAAPVITKDQTEIMTAKKLEAARASAAKHAEDQLVEFLAGYVQYSISKDSKEVQQIYEEIDKQGFKEEKTEQLFMDRLHEISREKAQAHIRGLVTIKEWQTNHPMHGHPVVGVVMMWSPTTKEAVDESMRRKRQRRYRPDEAGEDEGKPSSRESEFIDDPIDW